MRKEAQMSEQQAIEKKYRARLQEWRADLDKLKAQAAQADADARMEIERRVDDLEERRAAVATKLEELRDSGEKAAHELTEGLERSFDELSRGIKAAYESFKTR
jgi:hypothetical protein